MTKDLRREAASESSQGHAWSAPPLDRTATRVLRPEGALSNQAQFLRTPSGCERLFLTNRRGGALTRLPLASFFHSFGVACAILVSLVTTYTSGVAQTRTYPKEIRGYKVERTVVEVKKPETQQGNSGKSQSGNGNNSDGQASTESNSESDVDALIQLGKPELERVTPLGITFKVPIVVSPVKQSGHVDFLVFEDMVVNGTSVDIDEYHHTFDLPNKRALTLGDPVHIYIYLPNALLAALGDWNASKETWPVTGRVYVFGKFKKLGFSFKRVVPVELNLSMRNPLKEN